MGQRSNFSKETIVNKFGFEPVFGYIRVSTEGQRDKYGLDMQKRAILDYCLQNRLVCVKWFVDKESGTKIDRPALMEMLSGQNEQGVKKVVAFKSDRISRETKMYFYLLYEMEKRGLRLECITEEFDTESEFANLYRSMMLFVAEQERKNILYRTSKGKAVKRSIGGYCGGRIPYGYKANGKKELELDRIEAWIVLYIFYRYEQGTGLYKIATELDNRGYKSRNGKKIQQSTIRSILGNIRFYQGYVKDADGNEIRGRHPHLLKNIIVPDYPKSLKEGESLIIADIWSSFKSDPLVTPSQDIVKLRDKEHDKYMKYHKGMHLMNSMEAMEAARASRKPRIEKVEKEEISVDKLTLEQEIRRYMENAEMERGAENE